MSQDLDPDRDLDVVRELLRLRSDLPASPRRLALRTADLDVEVAWPAARSHASSQSGQSVSDDGDSGEASGALRHLLRSPTVGIARVSAEMGDAVTSGQTVATIRIMGLTVPVRATTAGHVAEILVGEEDPVEHDQPLLSLDPSAPD